MVKSLRASALPWALSIALLGACSSNPGKPAPADLDPIPPQATEASAAYTLPASLPIRNFLPISERVAGGGPPSAATIAEMRSMGYSTIINMRTSGEPGVAEEAVLAAEAGLHYVHIPISGSTTNLRNALALSQAIAQAPEGRILLHCGSGSRVGAMWGLKEAIEQGLDADTATQVARRSGLRSASYEERIRASIALAQSAQQ